MVQRAHAAAGKTGPYTVADAMDAYLQFLSNDGRASYTVRDARYRDQAFIRPTLGSTEVAALTAEMLRQWRDNLAQIPARVRTKKGSAQVHRKIADVDGHRARRSSANRIWGLLRAALNHAFRDGKASSDVEWRKVKPFKKVDSARVRYLTIAEARRLINAAEKGFRLLVQAALQTGARYGELSRLTVGDFNPDVGIVSIQQSKSGSARHVVLTDEGIKFFRRVCSGRASDEIMLCKANGSYWGFAHQIRPMEDTVERGKVEPPISFHGLRHTWASHAVMNGMPLIVVARNLGHVDTRMVEKHYGHLAPSYVANAVRQSAPRFGFKSD